LKYKNLNLAFLIEIFIGFGCVLSISFLGAKGIASLALIAIRPFVLEREKINDEKLYWQFSYKIMLNSVIIIFLMIISIFVIIQFIPLWQSKLPSFEVLLLVIVPFFVLTHGVMGILNYSSLDQEK
jgi:hypothetical protein